MRVARRVDIVLFFWKGLLGLGGGVLGYLALLLQPKSLALLACSTHALGMSMVCFNATSSLPFSCFCLPLFSTDSGHTDCCAPRRLAMLRLHRPARPPGCRI